MTERKIFTVDSLRNDDFDDALSMDAENFYVHIALPDSSAKVLNDSMEYSEYSIDGHLKKPFLENYQDYSLIAGKKRNVRTLRISKTNLMDFSFVDEAIVVSENTSYRLFEKTPEYEEYRTFSKKLENFREGNLVDVPQLVVKSDGTYAFERTGEAEKVIAEFMLIYCNRFARNFHKHRIVYLNNNGELSEPLTTRKDFLMNLDSLGKSTFSFQNEGHWLNGMQEYARATSPLRRGDDFANHMTVSGIQTDFEFSLDKYDKVTDQRIFLNSFLEDGTTHKGIVTCVKQFGVFVAF